jgi:hypothetical protein
MKCTALCNYCRYVLTDHGMRATIYEELTKECQEERQCLETMVIQLEAEQSDHVTNLDAALHVISQIGEHFAKCTPEQQRAILLQMVERVIIHRGGRIKTIEWKPPFCYLVQLSQDVEEQQNTPKAARKPKVVGKKNGSFQLSILAPGENRTPDARFRRPALYPLSYGCVPSIIKGMVAIEQCRTVETVMVQNTIGERHT